MATMKRTAPTSAPTTKERARARLCHKVARLWEKPGTRGPMVKNWREVCGWALEFAPKAGADPVFHAAIVAALGFAKPHMRGQWSSIDAWAREPMNVGSLAAQLHPILRTHGRGADSVT